MSKILYFITKSNWGGAQRHVYDLATSPLILNNYQVKVYAGISGKNDLLFEKLQTNGVATDRINIVNNFNFIKSFFQLFEIYKILKNERPSIVHVHSSKISIMIALTTRIYNLFNLKKIKIIFTGHGWYHDEHRPFIVKKITQYIILFTVALADTTICVSESTKKSLTNNSLIQYIFRKKLKVIYNGIPLNQNIKLPKLKKTINSPHYGKINLVSIGELHKNKGHDTVIRYLNELEHIHYHIIGEGQWRAHLEKLIIVQNKAGHNKVTLHGHVMDAAHTLNQYDIFLMPSRKEGFAYTVPEALAAGLPVIARDVGGVAEIKGAALTLYNDDYELIKILKNWKMETLIDYHEWLDDRFSVEHMVAETVKAYKL